MMKLIYLDYAAATPMDERVVEAMKPYFSQKFFNPSSPYLPAVETRQQYQQAKAVIAKFIGAKADQLVMTAGATESINLAFSGSKQVIISGVEHPAVLAVAQTKQIKVAPVSKVGIVKLDELEAMITDQTDLVSVCLASSDLGSIQPISQISQLIKQINQQRSLSGNKTKLLLHCDASQGLGQVDVNISRLSVDLLTISAAKIYGPKQVAALWIRPGVKLVSQIHGGGQELGLRSGTENVAGVIGFAKAIEIIKSNQAPRVAKLRDQFETELTDQLGETIKFLAHPKKRLANFSVFSLLDVDAERMIYRLERRGVLLSTGAACAANRSRGSMALVNIGLSDAEQQSSLRMSIGRMTTQAELIEAAKIIADETKLERKRLKGVK